jgi:hypothetical protein
MSGDLPTAWKQAAKMYRAETMMLLNELKATAEEKTSPAVRFLAIAKELAALRLSLLDSTQTIVDLKVNISAIESELTPADGWPGKNADERKAAAERTFASDGSLINLYTMLDSEEEKSRRLAVEITILEDERRGLEWASRFELQAYQEIPY